MEMKKKAKRRQESTFLIRLTLCDIIIDRKQNIVKLKLDRFSSGILNLLIVIKITITVLLAFNVTKCSRIYEQHEKLIICQSTLTRR